MQTKVAIVGAGPAGLLLSHLLHLEGIESVVLEVRSRRYCEERVRAGVLEQGAVDLLRACGLGDRMAREGLVHGGIHLRFAGEQHRVDFRDLTGQCVTVYGQQEVVKDLIAARLAAHGEILFECSDVRLEGDRRVHFVHGGEPRTVDCDFIAGCDGFHGVCRQALPEPKVFEREYPFAWLGILAHAAPASEELIYSNHERGFALLSMRSPSVTRMYLQCAPDEDLAQWPDQRIWDELGVRLGRVNEGPVFQKGVTPMRSFVVEPMRHGRLFLAGDAAHIVPPAGAKGMNLAMADVYYLSRALRSYYVSGSEEGLAGYSETCLRRVWRAQHFSWWMTALLHRFPGEHAEFDYKRQIAELRNVASSRAAATYLAENYTGSPGCIMPNELPSVSRALA